MVETTIGKFKDSFRETIIANIQKSYGSVEEFADEKGYKLSDLKEMLNGNFRDLDSFLKLLLDTNWTVSFKDHFDHNFKFPETFTIPLNTNVNNLA